MGVRRERTQELLSPHTARPHAPSSGRPPVLAGHATVSRSVLALAACLSVAVPSSARAQIDPGLEFPDRWRLDAAPQADLWYHALAVIAADQPGPLGLYSADYARRIREVKQTTGLYPTKLDSVSADLRDAIAEDSVLDVVHFIPLYFARAGPERMLRALDAVSRRRGQDPALAGPDVRTGALILASAFQGSSQRRTLQRLVAAVENEWEVFFRRHWEETRADRDVRYTSMQALWDTLIRPPLEPFLERRRLVGGFVMPSPALGPEGRIVDFNDLNPRDQVVAVQVPPAFPGPEATVFAFLKELCFLLVDDRLLAAAEGSGSGVEFEDLRRRVAVRCGALILDFYAPTLAARYRRVFLDAVGAEESATVAAFERVFSLDPAIWEVVREEVRRR